jgi:hypothetical protein
MGIRYAIRLDNSIEVQQTFDSPSVYLDHWAIRRFSDDIGLQERFVKALHEKRGTLLLCHLNLAEFVGPNDPASVDKAEVFLEAALPNIYFSELNVQKAIDQETTPRTSGVDLPPPSDRELLKLVAQIHPSSPRPFTMKGLIAMVAAERERLGNTFRASNQRIVDRVLSQRSQPEFVEKARNFRPSRSHPRTQIIMAELLRPVFLDLKIPFTITDASDLQHAILPISYCDYVLLDGKWKHMVQVMAQRISKWQLPIKCARCFSDRKQDLERFLLELEADQREK